MKNVVTSLLAFSISGILAFILFGVLGYTFGYDYGERTSYQSSFQIGYADAINSNKEIGYQDGFLAGFDEGLIEGIGTVQESSLRNAQIESYELGFNDGLFDGENKGYDSGYNVGFEKGSERGFQNGIEKISEYYIEYNSNLIIRPFTDSGYSCGNQLCERLVSNNPSNNRVEWHIFDLINLRSYVYVNYESEGQEMQQRIIVDYLKGELSGEWVSRSSQYSTPFIIYNFHKDELIKNTTSSSDNVQLEFLLNWYEEWSNLQLLGQQSQIEWLLYLER